MLQYASPEAEMQPGNNVFLNGAWYRCHQVRKNGKEILLRRVAGEGLATLLRRLGAVNRKAQEDHDGSKVQVSAVQQSDDPAGPAGRNPPGMLVQSKDPDGAGSG